MDIKTRSEQGGVRALRFFLPRKHWLRLLADDLLNGNIPEEYDFQQLLKTAREKGMFNPRPAIAAWVLGELQLSEVQKSEATLALSLNIPSEMVHNKLWRNKLLFRNFMTYIVVVYGPLLLIRYYIHQKINELTLSPQSYDHPDTIFHNLMFLLILSSFALFSETIIFAVFTNFRIVRSQYSILKMERPEGIGAIAWRWLIFLRNNESFTVSNKNSAYKQFFERTVSKVEPKHLGALGPRAMPRLSKLLQILNRLKTTDTEPLILSILHALQLAGDGTVIPTLESLTKNGRSEAVKSAAAEALPVILERAEQLQKSGTLLRPSSDGLNQQELLRAASSQSELNPETLLRPGSPEPEGVKLYENQEEAQTLENRAQS